MSEGERRLLHTCVCCLLALGKVVTDALPLRGVKDESLKDLIKTYQLLIEQARGIKR